MDKRAILQLIDQAFLPAKEIEIPQLFSGREEEIVQGLHALRSPGASICLYGRRGVGKSSIAKQLRLVASGYSALTDLLSRQELFSETFSMPSVYFYCDDTIKDLNDLFRKLLCDRDSLDGIARFNDGTILRRTKEKKSATARLTLRLLEASSKDEMEIENVVAEIDPVSAFKSVTSEIVDSGGTNSMVVVIDEFERVINKAGIASVIKTSPNVKFMIVGVSEDLTSLIADHASISRHLAEGSIKISPMTPDMLIEILKRAEAIIKEIRITEDVIAKVVEVSEGYPHWVHLLGKWTCIDAVEKGASNVTIENYNRALQRLVKNEPLYEDLYMRVTEGDKENELLLKILTASHEDKFNPEENFKLAEVHGISYVVWIKFVRRLISESILRPIEHNFTTFGDVRFKVYANVRPPLYPENRLETLNRGVSSWDNYIDYYIDNVALSPVVVQDLNNFSSAYYHIASNYVATIGKNWEWLKQEKKPILYDNKGRPIK